MWRALASEHGDPILDIGAGTGRVALDLVSHGHRVTALDRDPALLAELADHAQLRTVRADARSFTLGHRFALCLVPMQTIQLLGGARGRRDFLRCAQRHLSVGGVLAAAIADALEPYEVSVDSLYPLADMCERSGVVYSSQPIAIRADHDGYVLERRRETITASEERRVEHDLIRLDRLTPEQLEQEAVAVGMRAAGRARVAPTREHAGSVVVMLST